MWVFTRAVHTAIVNGKPCFCFNSWFIQLEKERRFGTTGSRVPVGLSNVLGIVTCIHMSQNSDSSNLCTNLNLSELSWFHHKVIKRKFLRLTFVITFASDYKGWVVFCVAMGMCTKKKKEVGSDPFLVLVFKVEFSKICGRFINYWPKRLFRGYMVEAFFGGALRKMKPEGQRAKSDDCTMTTSTLLSNSKLSSVNREIQIWNQLLKTL